MKPQALLKFSLIIGLSLVLTACGRSGRGGDGTNSASGASSVSGGGAGEDSLDKKEEDDGSMDGGSLADQCTDPVDGFAFDQNPIIDSGNPSLAFNASLAQLGQNVRVCNLSNQTGNLASREITIDKDSMYAGTLAQVEQSLVFAPADPRFQQVMAYHYGNQVVQSVKATGQFSTMAQLSIDAHCNEEANAYYSPAQQELCLGYVDVNNTRVWASDDADVIMHETSHAINAELASTEILNSTSEAGALDEALADFWAHTNNNNPQLSEWFIEAIEAAFNINGVARDASDNSLYPQSMQNQVHNDSKVFSEALWSIRQQIGAEKTNRIVAMATTLIPSVTMYEDAVNAVIAAANLLGANSADLTAINSVFTNKGLKRTDSTANLDAPNPALNANDNPAVYVIDDHSLSIQSNGNCNGILDEGETALVLVNLKNLGAQPMGAIKMTLTENDSTVQIPAGGNIGTYFRIDADTDFANTLQGNSVEKEDATIAAAFAIQANSGSASNGGQRIFEITVEMMGGGSVSFTLTMNIGTTATSNNCTNNNLWP